MIKVIAIGKKHETWLEDGIKRYESRLRKPYNVKWDLVPHSSLDEAVARQKESDRILSRIASDDQVILLDERGTTLSSPALSGKLEKTFITGKNPTFIIGGAYGVTSELRARAETVLSLSPLVFPHQLVRLILIEQIYRCQAIAGGSSYHHA